MLGTQKARHTIHHSADDPTEYAGREGFNSEAYSELVIADESPGDAPNRNWPSPISLAVVILVTAFGLAVAILSTVKMNGPSEPAPSRVVWDSVRTALSSSPAPPDATLTVTVTPSNSPPAPVTVTTRETPPATMTNPLEPAVTNPVVTTTVTNPVVTTTVTSPEPAPATMTNPLEPPATMTNPLEPNDYEAYEED